MAIGGPKRRAAKFEEMKTWVLVKAVMQAMANTRADLGGGRRVWTSSMKEIPVDFGIASGMPQKIQQPQLQRGSKLR